MENDDDDRIPTKGAWREVPLHAGQTPRRLRQVRNDIDAAYELKRVDELFAFCADPMRAPEARIFAGAKLMAMNEIAAGDRQARAKFDKNKLEALVGSLDSLTWRCPTTYQSLLLPPGVPRETPLSDD